MKMRVLVATVTALSAVTVGICAFIRPTIDSGDGSPRANQSWLPPSSREAWAFHCQKNPRLAATAVANALTVATKAVFIRSGAPNWHMNYLYEILWGSILRSFGSDPSRLSLR
jgi:hypothetical protein